MCGSGEWYPVAGEVAWGEASRVRESVSGGSRGPAVCEMLPGQPAAHGQERLVRDQASADEQLLPRGPAG